MKYDELLNQYQAHYKAKNYKEALKYAKKAIYSDPKQYEAWALLGNLYLLDLQATEDALRIVERALAKYHPKNVSLLEIQAQALFKLGKYKDSFDILKLILSIDPESSNLWDQLDKIYASERSLQPQIDTLRNNLFQVNLDKARNYAITNKFDEALQFFQKAIQIIPSNPDALEDLARLYHAKKNYGASQAYVNQLMVIKPNDVSLLNIKAYNLWGLHQFEDAHENFTKSLKIKPGQATIQADFDKLQTDIAQIYNNEGDAQFRKAEFDDALKTYQKTLHFHKGDAYALQKMNEVRAAIQKQSDSKKEQETQQFLAYIAQEAQINEEILLEDILREMPAHEDVKDEPTLRMLLKQLILNQRVIAGLTPTGLKFSRGSSSVAITPQNAASIGGQKSHNQFQTVLLKQTSLPVIIIREGVADGRGYHFTVKIKNNQPFPIREINLFILYPQDCLALRNENPQIIPIIHPGQLQEKIFDFNITSPLLEGIIHSVVFYINTQGEMQVHTVSGHQIENITSTIRPLQMDPQRLGQFLQQAQQFPVNQDKFSLNLPPTQAFSNIQQELQTMHFYILKAAGSDTGGRFSGYINASGMPETSKEPIFIEIQIAGITGQNATDVIVATRTATAKISRIVSNTVKGSLIMPKCPICDQSFPISLYSKIKRNDNLVCEYCGSMYKPKSPSTT